MSYNKKLALLEYGSIAILCCLLYYCECKISEIKEKLPYILKQSFVSAIERDLDEWFKEANIRQTMGCFNQGSDNTPGKGYTIISKDTTEYIPADSACTARETSINIERQAILTLFNPIRPPKIDSLLRIELAAHQIPGKTLVVSELNHTDKTYSHTDTTWLSSALRTDTVVLGLKKEIRLQAFLSYPRLHYLKIAKGFLIGILACIAGLAVAVKILQRKKGKRSENTAPVFRSSPLSNTDYEKRTDSGKDISSSSTPLSYINYPYRHCVRTKFDNHSLYELGGISFDFYEFELILNGKKTGMTPQNRHILQTLLDGHDCFLNRKELYERLWPGKLINYNKLNKSISRLRESLAAIDPRLGIKTFFKNGYQIEIKGIKEYDREAGLAYPVIDLNEEKEPV